MKEEENLRCIKTKNYFFKENFPNILKNKKLFITKKKYVSLTDQRDIITNI